MTSPPQCGEQAYYTIPEAAALLRVSNETVRRSVHSGALKALKIGRQWRIPASSLEGRPSEGWR